MDDVARCEDGSAGGGEGVSIVHGHCQNTGMYIMHGQVIWTIYPPALPLPSHLVDISYRREELPGGQITCLHLTVSSHQEY